MFDRFLVSVDAARLIAGLQQILDRLFVLAGLRIMTAQLRREVLNPIV
jgi:hypothetical protein